MQVRQGYHNRYGTMRVSRREVDIGKNILVEDETEAGTGIMYDKRQGDGSRPER